MSHGVPVISSNAGGLQEVNVHGKTGYLSDIGNISDMTKNALILLQNDRIHKEFKIKAL